MNPASGTRYAEYGCTVCLTWSTPFLHCSCPPLHPRWQRRWKNHVLRHARCLCHGVEGRACGIGRRSPAPLVLVVLVVLVFVLVGERGRREDFTGGPRELFVFTVGHRVVESKATVDSMRKILDPRIFVKRLGENKEKGRG